MKARIAAGIALVALLGSGQALATGKVYGYGILGCGKFIEAIEEKRAGFPCSADLFMTWLSGFVSYAAASQEHDYFEGTDAASVQLWLENYCRTNPLEPFNSAAIRFLYKRNEH